MDTTKDYASESDLSDEDFCPENEAASELSEESSDDEIDDDDQNAENETKATKKSRKSKKRKNQKLKTTKQEENQLKRTTRQKTEINDDDVKKVEKDELESDDEKARADALWADFLGDVKQTTDEVKEEEKVAKQTSTEKSPTSKTNKTSTITKASTTNNGDILNGKEIEEEKPKQITITEIMDFAGEEVKVQKVVSAESIKENKTTTAKNAANNVSNQTSAIKRSAPSGSGLNSILNQIGKKKKLSVLEKTKLDWNSFKQDEGIDEELQTFNKGKDGYLERQDFLQRTDLRQFERERNMRQTRRNH